MGTLKLPSTAGVYGIYGSLGGGKTLSAVDIAITFLRSGQYVVSNIRLLNLEPREQLRYSFVEDLREVKWFDLPCGSPRGSGGSKRVAVILDELPELLDQYTSGKEPWVRELLSWLRHTSKRGQFVFLITQSPSFINKSVRTLVAYWFRCDDMAQLRLPVIRLPLYGFGGFVMRRLYDRDGNCLNHSMDLVSKKEIGQYYNTAQGLSLFGKNEQQAFDDRQEIFFRKCDDRRRVGKLQKVALMLYALLITYAVLTICHTL